MLKKEYITPDCQVVELKAHNTLLAGSPEEVQIGEEILGGYGD